jgi:hypothetical protein
MQIWPDADTEQHSGLISNFWMGDNSGVIESWLESNSRVLPSLGVAR